MITGLHLGNFKAFAETQRVPIKPLTLIFGANSAGKSSILHGLLMGHHLINKGTLDVHKTEVGGELLDLGGFSQYVHRGDTNRSVIWDLTVSPDSGDEQLFHILGQFKQVSVGINLQLMVELDFKTLGVNGIKVTTDDTKLIEMGSGTTTAVFEHLWGGVPNSGASNRFANTPQMRTSATMLGTQYAINSSHPAINRWLEDFWKKFANRKLNTSDLQIIKRRWTSDICYWPVLVDALFPGDIDDKGFNHDTPLAEFGRGRRVNLREAKRSDVVRFANQAIGHFLKFLFNHLRRAMVNELDRVLYLGPLRAYPSRRLLFPAVSVNVADGSAAWQAIATQGDLRRKINAWLGNKDRLSTPYEIIVRNWVEFDSFAKRAAGSLARRCETSLKRRNSAIAETEFRKLLGAFSDKVGSMLEVLLLDKRSNTLVSNRDIGVGLSQVLPVLASAYGATNSCIVIEEPEIHTHPALQAEMADVFIESALGESKNTCLLETHSEHLILRILRRVRETTAGKPNGLPPIRPEDVSVLYVQPGPNGAEVIELPVTPDGDFDRPWPGGFFAERFNDLP